MRYRESILVRHTAPFDPSLAKSDAEYLLTDANATASYLVLDKAAQTTVAELPTSAVIKVANAGVFAVGDKVQVIKDDDVELIANVDDVDTSAGTITLDSTPSPQLTVGSTIRKVYGPAGAQRVAMPIAGNSNQRVDEVDWWFEEKVDMDDFSDLVPGVEFEAESIVQKTAGTGWRSIGSVCDTVQDDCGEAA